MTLEDAKKILKDAEDRYLFRRRRAYDLLGWGTSEEIARADIALLRSKENFERAKQRVERLSRGLA